MSPPALDTLHVPAADRRLNVAPPRPVSPLAYPGHVHDDRAAAPFGVADTAAAAIAAANLQHACDPGYCLRNVRGWLGIDARDNDAQEAYDNALHRHPGDAAPPDGAPMFWAGGSLGFGHIGLRRYVDFRGTDMPAAGQVGNDLGSWPVAHWGMRYLGWSEDLNGVLIPYLAAAGRWRAGGDVYCSKLHFGQTNSDSVARLRYRLANHDGMAGSGHRPAYGHNYGDDCRDGVRWWVRNLCPVTVPGPRDGSALSPEQAAHLFGPAYTLHRS